MPTPPKYLNADDLFAKLVYHPDGCWEGNTCMYQYIRHKDREPRPEAVYNFKETDEIWLNRIVWCLKKPDDTIKGWAITRTCQRGGCVNPDHYFKSYFNNIQRGIKQKFIKDHT